MYFSLLFVPEYLNDFKRTHLDDLKLINVVY